MWFFCFELGLSPKRKRNSRINKSDMLVICLSERKGWARICIGHTFSCLMRLHEYRVIPATINVPDRLCILMHVTAVCFYTRHRVEDQASCRAVDLLVQQGSGCHISELCTGNGRLTGRLRNLLRRKASGAVYSVGKSSELGSVGIGVGRALSDEPTYSSMTSSVSSKSASLVLPKPCISSAVNHPAAPLFSLRVSSTSGYSHTRSAASGGTGTRSSSSCLSAAVRKLKNITDHSSYTPP
mmetsp:Transcript_15685/g.40562  ORF Transcript_15685/g.40562 Transcript_15685/m.40562 type:complete len:240 (-) Transcript_15685:1122-1841(-)